MEEQNKNLINDIEDKSVSNETRLPSFQEFHQNRIDNAEGFDRYISGGKQFRRGSAREYAAMARGDAQDKIKKLIAQKTKQALAQAARSAAVAIWTTLAATLGPYATIVVICVLLLVLTALPAVAMWNKARKGTYGNSAGTYASAAASSGEVKIAMEELRELYNQKLIISDHPESFYWSQGDPAFQETLNGHWDTCRPQLACAGCALTSISMIFRYFGASGFSSPVDVANYNASINGGDLNIVIDPLVSHYLPDKNVFYHKPGNLTFATIKEQIAKGMPILAGGKKVCGSDGQHWVVIIGLSADENNVIISDPAHDERSSPARYCSKNNMNISKYAIFSDK